MIIPYNYPEALPRDDRFSVRTDRIPLEVFRAGEDAFVSFGMDGPTTLEVTLPPGPYRLRPHRPSPLVESESGRLRIEIAEPGHFMVDRYPHGSLFLYANPPEPPAPAGARVRRYAPGRLYDEGEVVLESGETLYLPAGAVLRGRVRASDAEGVRITGFGVLDGGYFADRDLRRRSLVLDRCRDVRIEGLTMIRPTGWMLVVGASEDVTIERIRQIGQGHGTDGMDIVGSRRVRVADCMLRNGDDNIAVKSLDLRAEPGIRNDMTEPVEDIEVTRCAFFNDLGGTAMEIGHELRCDTVRNICFHDIDIMGVQRFGAVFGIHNADHAVVSDILWENIRVEHHYDRLISFRIIRSRWSKDSQRGQIRNITLRNCDIVVSEYNPGYTHSLIGGYDAQHTVEGVTLVNVRLNGVRTGTDDDLDLYRRHAAPVAYLPGEGG